MQVLLQGSLPAALLLLCQGSGPACLHALAWLTCCRAPVKPQPTLAQQVSETPWPACRSLGVDAEHISPDTQRKHVPACIAQATGDGRMFVTRDQRLAARPGLGALFLLSTDDAQGQLEEVVQHFGIRCAAEI